MLDSFAWAGNYVPLGEGLLRLVVAALCGLALGFDREAKRKPVGMRAFMLVTVGAAGYAMVSMELSVSFRVQGNDATVDPSRVIQGLVGAFGFLGAGAIISSQGKIQGVATAAAVWASGAIGIACGLGFLLLALLLTGLALGSILVAELIEKQTGLQDRETGSYRLKGEGREEESP